MSNIPQGFQKTEVGVIPDDWKVIKLIEDVSLFSGQHILASKVNNRLKGIPYITGPMDFENGCINSDKFTEFPQVICKKEDILLTVKGSGSGKLIIADKEYCISRQLMAIRPKESYSKYIFYILKNNINYFANIASGLIPGISRENVLGLPIPLPPTKAEQTAIATALNDADKLITELEKLIAKKRNIKQGAMQELITGKRRLPGFEKKKGNKQTEVGVIPSDWNAKKLVSIAEICTGSTPPTIDQNNYGNDYLFVSPFDLGKEKFIRNTEKKLSLKGLNLSRKYPKNSILFTCIGSTIGKCGIADRELASNQQINAVLPNDTFNSDFLFYSLNLLSHKIKRNASETAVPIINKTEFGETLIPLPPTKVEQTCIAQILSDMDTEMAALEKKLEKYKMLKQGMMQNLLTGKIRLVQPVYKEN